MGDEINSKMSQLPCSGGTLLMYFLHGPSDGPRGIQPQLPTVVNSSLTHLCWLFFLPCLLLYLGGSSPLETEQRPREGDSKMVQAVAPPQPWGTSPWLLPRGSGAYQEGDASPASTCWTGISGERVWAFVAFQASQRILMLHHSGFSVAVICCITNISFSNLWGRGVQRKFPRNGILNS